MIPVQNTKTTKSSWEISELAFSLDVSPGKSRIHSLSFACVKRSYQNASQEVKFAWQGLIQYDQPVMIPNKIMETEGVLKLIFAEGHPHCWVLVLSHSKGQAHKGMREEVSLPL